MRLTLHTIFMIKLIRKWEFTPMSKMRMCLKGKAIGRPIRKALANPLLLHNYS